VPAIAPELMAAGASSPWRWKKRTRTPKTAASPPTNDVNMLEVSRATHRPKGSGADTAPVRAQAPVTTGSCPSTKAAATQPHAAPRMTLSEAAASVRTPMISHRPTRLPMNHQQIGPADPLRLHQFRHLDPGGSSERLAPAFEKAFLRPGHPLGLGVERGALQLGQHCLQRLRVEHPGGRDDGAVDAHHRGNGGDGGGQVAVGPHRRRRRRGAPEVTQQWALRRDENGLRTERAVRDPGLAQRQQGAEETVDVVVADLFRSNSESPASFGEARDEGGIVAGPHRPAATISGTRVPAWAARKVR